MFRVVAALLLFSSVPAAVPASEFELPEGEIAGGLVDDKGRALLVIRRSNRPADGSVVVLIERNRTHRVELHNTSIRYLSALSDGRLLLSGSETGTDGQWDAIDLIVEVDSSGGLERHWKFSGRAFDPPGNHGVPISVSGDGRSWGCVDDAGTAFAFGRTGPGEPKVNRTERLDVGGQRDVAVSELKWPMAPGFVFLDSEGPVVLVPWSGGAYILHFVANGSSPYKVPILFDDGVEEYDFRWQWEERVLWARTSLYWKAYDLWDLGLSPMREEPFLVVENSAEPHAERGAVRLATKEDRYRIEHVWRDPWFPVEETRVSEWRTGHPDAFFVSPNGRQAIVVEAHVTEEGDSSTFVRRMELALAPRMRRIEPDLEAEIAADRAVMPWLGTGSVKVQGEREDTEEDPTASEVIEVPAGVEELPVSDPDVPPAPASDSGSSR